MRIGQQIPEFSKKITRPTLALEKPVPGHCLVQIQDTLYRLVRDKSGSLRLGKPVTPLEHKLQYLHYTVKPARPYLRFQKKSAVLQPLRP